MITKRTVFYDVETDSKYAPYANLKICGLLWDDGTEETLTWPLAPSEIKYLRGVLADPTIIKVGFNNLNYDNLVLYRHGFPVNEVGCHDMILAAKTLYPEMPGFSMKFLNWWFFGDFHWPEYALLKATQGWKAEARFADGPEEESVAYNAHDLVQTRALWQHFLPMLVGRALTAYQSELAQGKVLEMMTFRGGLHIDREQTVCSIQILESARRNNLASIAKLTNHRLSNANSPQQVGKYFSELGYDIEQNDAGEFLFDKETIEDLWRDEPVAKCVKNLRKADSMLKYFRNYLNALNDPTFKRTAKEGWIPTSFNISGAGTRRYTSSSKHKLNFQNASSAAKRVQIVPRGWLGFWIDSTQIENVVHIYESKDEQRRQAYEADPDWSEYVWLCNMVLGTNKTKKELEAIVSPQNELWSVYKQYKTIKLMMNFGSGAKRFCNVSGFSLKAGYQLFKDIHRACPAIKRLQERVQRDYETNGEVYDVFGHVYRLFPQQAYKLVAYMIQGCGTASLPKAQLRANYDTIVAYNRTQQREVAVLCGTTHDECAGRVSLALEPQMLDWFFEELMSNMTDKFSPLFDNIPLRAKLYLSKTNAHDRIECKSYSDFLAKIRNPR